MSAPAAHRVIAIDGPAASGKSSVARDLAQRLGFVYVNSGAMYRAITWHVLEQGIATEEAGAIEALLAHASITSELRGDDSLMLIDGVDAEPFLRDDRVNENVSRVSSVRRVRKVVVAHLQRYARAHDLVMEGRDIGSVVFPETPYKFYIDASPDIRASRRAAQGQHDVIAARDRADASRRTSPLIIAEDAYVIDSSHLTIDGVVGKIIGRLKLKGLTISS